MKLLRVGIANYRSLGETPVIIDLSRRVTVLIGTNNSGKSNVLAGLVRLSETKWEFRRLGETDRHQRAESAWPRLVFEVEMDDALPGFYEGQQVRFACELQSVPTNDKWVEHPLRSLEFHQLNNLMTKVTGRRFTTVPNESDLERECSAICDRFAPGLLDQIPAVHLIPQYRQIQAGVGYEVHGTGVVELLASWQHPEIGRDSDTQRFLQIEKLLRHLLHIQDVRLEVSHDKKTIIVQRDGLRLPLQSYGTGVHQVIILAIAVMSHEDVIFCIEEPEIHLHPTLQRELLRFLIHETKNNYVLATHSPAFIDTSPEVDVIHLELSSHTTTPRAVQTPLDTLAILRDLGIRPSDLLQANAVIWVEGPSDRIYIKRWLELVGPELVEGIHYSVMFYGGRLLSHLALDRAEDASEFISLLRIAQNSAVLIDSDKRSKRKPISTTKLRVQNEGAATGAYVWITEGREIENLLPVEAIARCYEQLTQKRPVLDFGSYDSLEEVLKDWYGRSWLPKYSYNNFKPERAREIVKFIEPGMISSALRRRLDSLLQVIHSGPQLSQGGDVP